MIYQVQFASMKNISRREFLKLGGLSLASLAFNSFMPENSAFEDIELARVTIGSVSVYEQPDDKSRIVGTWNRDDLIHLYETVEAEKPEFNRIWYRVFGGYMHRARLQRVHIKFNPTPAVISDTKVIAELTVPYTQIYRYKPREGWSTDTRTYYGSIHWIAGIEQGPDGKAWYQLQDESDESIYFIPTAQLRQVPADEIAPFRPDASLDDHYIDVNLGTQTLVCYENSQAVFTADVSTGLFGLYDTPVGRFNVEVKLPSRWMRGSDHFASPEENLLAGVPWCCFFTDKGHAFHGTYWHDNFGLPMSHGCVNMRTEEAKWLFRWCRPKAALTDINQRTLAVQGYGTVVIIHF